MVVSAFLASALRPLMSAKMFQAMDAALIHAEARAAPDTDPLADAMDDGPVMVSGWTHASFLRAR